LLPDNTVVDPPHSEDVEDCVQPNDENLVEGSIDDSEVEYDPDTLPENLPFFPCIPTIPTDFDLPEEDNGRVTRY
jgi:hypothetical protein